MSSIKILSVVALTAILAGGAYAQPGRGGGGGHFGGGGGGAAGAGATFFLQAPNTNRPQRASVRSTHFILC